MPHKPAKDGGRTNATGRHFLAPPVDPFSSNASVDRISDWDIRPEQLAEFVLGFLGNGQAVMFGVGKDGRSVRVAVNFGEKDWRGETVRDAGEFIGVVYAAVRRLREAQNPEEAIEPDQA